MTDIAEGEIAKACSWYTNLWKHWMLWRQGWQHI